MAARCSSSSAARKPRRRRWPTICRAAPAATTARPFAETFAAYKGDFYQIDPMLFSPGVVQVTALDSGRSFRRGRLDPAILARSFASRRLDHGAHRDPRRCAGLAHAAAGRGLRQARRRGGVLSLADCAFVLGEGGARHRHARSSPTRCRTPSRAHHRRRELRAGDAAPRAPACAGRLGVPVINDAGAIERCVDKSMTSFLLHRAGIADAADAGQRERGAGRALARRHGGGAGGEAALRLARPRPRRFRPRRGDAAGRAVCRRATICSASSGARRAGAISASW